MADSPWNSNSGDRQYKTPKSYDYVQAVKDTAPIHPGNAAGGGESGTGYPPQFVKRPKNATQGNETRENIITRGKLTQKNGAGDRNATRKGTTEARRFGRKNNAPRGLKDLDPNLDPHLRYVGVQEYQQVPTGNIFYGDSTNANDKPGCPQRTGWQDPEDIEDGNRRLNSKQSPG